jgi:hypothetical protein
MSTANVLSFGGLATIPPERIEAHDFAPPDFPGFAVSAKKRQADVVMALFGVLVVQSFAIGRCSRE